MPCDCYKIGGPWIAEDPNCPEHGIEAQQSAAAAGRLRESQTNKLTVLAHECARATTVNELNEVVLRLINLLIDEKR